VQVIFDRARTDEPSRSDLWVRQPLTGKPRDLRLMAGLKPHDDLLADFPHLGPPNP
jgi:hypothetical protein